ESRGGGVGRARLAARPGRFPAPTPGTGAADGSTAGMSHEPKSPSLGMLSTATRTTATVSPLTPSPLNGSLVPSGSPAASSSLPVQSAPSSSFAAALRKLAKQAEEPRGSSISSESSPVSSPATNHSSPASTPKRGPMGPLIVPPGGHTVPSTPPVVTIAPTKTVNGIWRSEGRQCRGSWHRASVKANLGVPRAIARHWSYSQRQNRDRAEIMLLAQQACKARLPIRQSSGSEITFCTQFGNDSEFLSKNTQFHFLQLDFKGSFFFFLSNFLSMTSKTSINVSI
ncbi:Genetic suppressor element 1, partial [Varanus komodoensis]